MKEYYLPFDCDIETYEKRLSGRDFWDDVGHEWSRRKIEEKLVILGGFVKKGGDLKRVIERYVENRDEIYRSRIHWVIFEYIWRLVMIDEPISMNRTLADRIKCLDNDELLRLLSEELEKQVISTCTVKHNPIKPSVVEVVSCWIVSKENKFDDTILDKIERDHWRANPDESITHYWNKAKRWEHKYCFF